DGGVGAGGQGPLQQDLARAGVERVQITVERGGEDDVVRHRGGAVRRGRERGVPFDRAGVLVDRDHLAGRLLDGRQVGRQPRGVAGPGRRQREVVDGGERGGAVAGQLGLDAAEDARLEAERGGGRGGGGGA